MKLLKSIACLLACSVGLVCALKGKVVESTLFFIWAELMQLNNKEN